MELAWLVPVSLAFGVMVGVGVTLIVVIAQERGRRAAAMQASQVPAGVDQVLDTLESAGVVLDASNNVLKGSPGAHAMGLVWSDHLVHDELVHLVDQVRRTGEPLSEDIHLPRSRFGAGTIHLHVRVARLGDRYILLLADDRTEALRLDDVRRDFIANISHELKTPIGAVGLLAEAMSEASDDPPQVRKFARRLTKESQRLARITKEIIDLSRLQADEALRKPELVEVDSIVAQAIDQNRVPADKHEIRLVSGGDAGARIYGDEKLLTTALDNLISNAIQYSPNGSRIGIGVSNADGIVEISVTDQGIGIAEDERDRVFERFFRSDPARSRNTGGSGLGLSIVKHVVQNHGGDVRVWSQHGHGSTFTLRLPAASHAAAVSLGPSS